MHRYIYILLILCSLQLQASKLKVDVAAEAAILINADTGAILYEKNIHAPMYPASTTKVATAWYALKTNRERLDDVIVADGDAIASVTSEAIRRSNYTLPSWWIEIGSSHIGIKKGEELTLRDLLYGLMIRSGNDAANVIAQYVGGTIPNFLEDLNAEFKAMGLKNTNFTNPHGLHNPRHVTSAFDMAMIARAGMQDPVFREVVKTVRYTRPKTNKNAASTLVQTNQLMRQGKNFYAKAIGIKTGYTSIAQSNLVAAAEHNGRTLIAVLFKSPDRTDTFTDTKRLFETAFNQPQVERTLIKAGSQKFSLDLPGAQNPVKTWVKEDVKIQYYPAEEPVLKCLLCWKAGLETPIAQGQHVGDMKIVDQLGREIQTVNLYAEDEVKSGWGLWFKQLIR